MWGTGSKESDASAVHAHKKQRRICKWRLIETEKTKQWEWRMNEGNKNSKSHQREFTPVAAAPTQPREAHTKTYANSKANASTSRNDNRANRDCVLIWAPLCLNYRVAQCWIQERRDRMVRWARIAKIIQPWVGGLRKEVLTLPDKESTGESK